MHLPLDLPFLQQMDVPFDVPLYVPFDTLSMNAHCMSAACTVIHKEPFKDITEMFMTLSRISRRIHSHTILEKKCIEIF